MLSRPVVMSPGRNSSLAAIISTIVSLATTLADPNPHGGVGMLIVSVLSLRGLIALAIRVLVELGARARSETGQAWWAVVGVPVGVLAGAAIGSYAGDLFGRG